MNNPLRDIRYSVRSLVKRPGFALIAVFTLALGIGVNTAILSAVNGFILRPLPVTNANELVVPFWGSKKDAEVWGPFSYANYVDLRDQNRSLSGLLAWQMTSAGISSSANRDEEGRAEIAWGEMVSNNYFDVLDVKPALGRTFAPEEGRSQNDAPVVVLGHKLWERRFNSDPSIVGRTIYMNGQLFTVIGVGPEKFEGVKFAIRQDFWIPLMMQTKLNGGDPSWEKERSWSMFLLMGRLKPGVTMKQAETDLNIVAGEIARIYPAKAADTKVQVVSELDGRFGSFSKTLKFSSVIALFVSGLVLLVACANVANLMLARSMARTKEIGIRVAIGAGRLHIIRQLLTESILLSLIGGGLGWLFAYWGTALIQASIPPMPYPINLDVSPDLYVLKWMLLISVLTGVVFGLVPALVSSKPNLVTVLKGEVTGLAQRGFRQHFNLRGVLVVAQVALSIVVLVCAGLFLRSLNKALNADPGFNTENLISMRLDPGSLGYDAIAGKRFYTDLLKRVESQPGVHSASLTAFLLMGDSNGVVNPVIKEGDPDPLPNQGMSIERSIVAPKYFGTMGIQLLRGRDFTDHDNSDAPQVVIVNQEFARRFYGNEESALGKRLHFWWSGSPPVEIIGIAKDGLYRNVYEDKTPYLFIPEFQQYESGMTLLVKADSAANMEPVLTSVRREIAQLDPRVPVFGLLTAKENLSFAYWAPRLAAGMGTAFGGLALVLATMGLYGVMTYAVSQRTREIGIRIALGAQIRDVLKLVVSQGMLLVIVGLATGLIGAFLLTRVLSSLLIGVGASDPITFFGVSILLLLVALFACFIPARRASRVDPLKALRYE
ncbi:MAG TPA: ABC transporter permease [Pyrinomonadaceae bacterium]|nr:ABC transporter permease [Pyrinomonadaceae bacterium]